MTHGKHWCTSPALNYGWHTPSAWTPPPAASHHVPHQDGPTPLCEPALLSDVVIVDGAPKKLRELLDEYDALLEKCDPDGSKNISEVARAVLAAKRHEEGDE